MTTSFCSIALKNNLKKVILFSKMGYGNKRRTRNERDQRKGTEEKIRETIKYVQLSAKYIFFFFPSIVDEAFIDGLLFFLPLTTDRKII